MTNLAVPSRTSYVADLQVGTTVQGTITLTSKTMTIEPVQSNISERVLESTSFEGGMALFPRVS